MVKWSGAGMNIKFIDTGGFIYDDRNDFNSAIRIQANDAIVESDLILLMVDGKQGLMPNDKILAKSLEKKQTLSNCCKQMRRAQKRQLSSSIL